MYWLDTMIVVVLGVGALLGALSGLLKQLARLVGLAVALVGAILLHDWAAERLGRQLPSETDPRVSALVAYVVVFLAIYLVIFLATLVLERCMTAIHLQMINRVLGAGLGVAKTALILGAVLLGLSHYPQPRGPEILEPSALAPVLVGHMEKLVAAIPPQYRDDLRSGLLNLQDFSP